MGLERARGSDPGIPPSARSGGSQTTVPEASLRTTVPSGAIDVGTTQAPIVCTTRCVPLLVSIDTMARFPASVVFETSLVSSGVHEMPLNSWSDRVTRPSVVADRSAIQSALPALL